MTANMVVREVKNPSKRTGTSQKTGKQWNMAEVIVDDGKVVTVFGHPQVGQEVADLSYDDKYQSWNGKLVFSKDRKDMSEPSNVQHNEVMGALRRVFAKLEEVEQKLNDIAVPSDIPDQINLDDIPFGDPSDTSASTSK
jgi:hypothetical protein